MRGSRHFEAIVVGAGSAGCVTASRLSAAGIKTLLVEAGPEKLSVWQRLPLGVGRALKDSARTWTDSCEASNELGGRQLEWHAGRGIGGSSAVNGMLAVRGDPALYDSLAGHGIAGWSYAECLPHFKRLESVRFRHSGNRGSSGPITLTRIAPDRFSRAFHAAFNSLGIASGDDYNDAYGTGVYQLQLTASSHLRADASRYLARVADRSRLTVASESPASKLVVKEGRVHALEVIDRDRSIRTYTADNFFLCLGAIRTPLLLERSGVGNPQTLEGAGLTVMHALRSVGEHLKDHVMVRQTFESRHAGTANDLFLSKSFAVAQGLRYLTGQPNLFATPSLVSTAFVPVSSGDPSPRFRVQLGLASAEGRLSTNLKTGIDPFPGFHFGVYDISPQSYGHVHITAGQPERYSIRNNYLTGDGDLQRLRQGFDILEQLAASSAMKDLTARRTRPDSSIGSPESVLQYFARSAHTCWHPVGTCRMGADPETSVTSAHGRVHGLDNLMIFDASIYPVHTSSNTNLPVLMAAEKLSSEFLGTR